MLKTAIITGSTRPNRKSPAVAEWVKEIAEDITDDATFEIVDIADYDLPLLDEPVPPSKHQYSNPHTEKWSETIASYDAFIFVTPEYNHSTSGALKNAIDYLYDEWNNKVAGFVSYGSAGGVRAVEHLRGIMSETQTATVRSQVFLSLATDFENYTEFTPGDHHRANVEAMIEQLIRWGQCFQAMRARRDAELNIA